MRPLGLLKGWQQACSPGRWVPCATALMLVACGRGGLPAPRFTGEMALAATSSQCSAGRGGGVW